MTHLLLTVRFLDDRYHGLLDRDGPPEWPPSPFRLFQALVAGVARRGELVIGDDVPSNTNFTDIGQALGWLQRHTREYPPIIIAPKSKTGQAITRFVPNNDADKKFDRQERLTAKPTIPTLFLLEPDQKPEVHYVWELPEKHDCPIANTERAARSLTALGWGIDVAFADARLASEPEIQQLKGIRWYPKKNAGSFRDTLRVPTYDDEINECTLSDLLHCHSTFINRIEHGKPLKTVDKPKIFDRVLYTSTERPISRPYQLFALRNTDDEFFRYPQAKLIHIAGMVRHKAITAMKAYPPLRISDPEKWVDTFVAGHSYGADDHKQFSYVPLPSIGQHADCDVRRVMIVAPFGEDANLAHLAEQLDGCPLERENGGEAPILHRLRGDGVTRQYIRQSKVWATVTPIILPGHDGHKPAKTRKLLLAAFQRSGIEQPCEFTWSAVPNFKNSLSAYSHDQQGRHVGYFRPDHLHGLTAVHARLLFGHPVPGPLVVGAGRHCGFGVMAAVDGGS